MFHQLPPDADRVQIAAAVRDVIKAMNAAGVSYNNIAALVSMRPEAGKGLLSENSLKAFIRRRTPTRINTKNTTLERLYNYIKIHEAEGKLPLEAHDVVRAYWPILEPTGVAIEELPSRGDDYSIAPGLVSALRNHLRVRGDDLARIGDIAGRYVMLRKSLIDSRTIVKTHFAVVYAKSRAALYCEHRFDEPPPFSGIRISRGILLPCEPNIYGFLKIRETQALEFLGLSSPRRQGHPILGFLMTVDGRGNVASARILLEKETDLNRRLPTRMIEGTPEFDYMNHRLRFLDHGTGSRLPEI